jgi:hypothetical protein
VRWFVALWKSRWSFVRIAAAAFLLWAVGIDTAARLARLQLTALPGFDYAAEVRSLRNEQRYGEAVMVSDAGLRELEGPEREALLHERKLTIEEQDSFIRRAVDAGSGALTGRGDSLESLAGAIAADFFIVGDVRDLIIQGGKQMLDGDSDELVLLLSIVGVVTTLLPEVDWVPAILKAARRAGSMTDSMATYLKRAIKGRDGPALRAVLDDTATIAIKGSPGSAMRLLKHVDDPADLRAMAKFASDHPGGVFALHVTGREGLVLIKQGDEGAALVLKAATKGRAGAAFLRTKAARVLIRPHPVVGLLKALWKGNAEKAAQRFMERMDPKAWWIVPLLAAWLVVELGIMTRRFRKPRAA